LLTLWRFGPTFPDMPSSPPRRPPKHTPVLVKGALERLGARLVFARKLREMTQEQLAALSDVSPSTLRSLEEGADGVSIGNFLKVMQGLQLLEQMEGLLDAKQDPEAVGFAERQLGHRS
jgi:DNA-binding XRE family transcriptional regulator